jgi:CO dehydrogenase maturation factor
MRLAIAGKGGSGKTTIAATLARWLGRRGYRVVAIDGDPNPNLAVALGVSADERAALKPIPRDLVEEVHDLSGHVHLTVAKPLHQIADEYGAAGPDGIRLLVGSQVDRAGAG